MMARQRYLTSKNKKMTFHEYDGMILLESPSSTERNIHELKERGRWHSCWQYERGANHIHAQMSLPDREHVREELKIAARFAAALRETYPDRDFIITHIPSYAVSFYQPTEDSPTKGTVPVQRSKFWVDSAAGDRTVWCQNCQMKRPYRLLPIPDRSSRRRNGAYARFARQKFWSSTARF